MLKDRIAKIMNPGLIPVVRLTSAENLLKLCESFEKGGIRSVELTMTMPNAVDLLSDVKKEFQERLQIGMGTILSVEDAKNAMDGGADFLVSPVPVKGMAEQAHRQSVPVIMGAFTPYEAFTAHLENADFVKIFPLSLTTPKYLKTIREPMPFLKLIPSGGIAIAMLPELFENGASAVCIGGDLVRKDLIEQRKWEAHLDAVRKAVETANASRTPKTVS